jgi:hypothetical protein
MKAVSYILPLKSRDEPTSEFIAYVNHLAAFVEVIVVDGSDDALFDALDRECGPAISHVRPDPEFGAMRNGKVRGVLTGLQLARFECVIIADDDVRYSSADINEVAATLQTADVVRPQNFFEPLPWHARIDTARTLINRMTGGDWPGTLAVRRSTMVRVGGYDGDVLFENLELVRTVQAAGGREVPRQDLFVRRLPPPAHQFWRQRVRHAYDEFARPVRLVAAMIVIPLLLTLVSRRRYAVAIAAMVILPVCVAELGRRRSGGTKVFPWSASLCAPIWVVERGVCAWLALAARLVGGGIRYNGKILAIAAHSRSALARRWALEAPP